MQTWKATCSDGFTKNVEAETKNEAVKMFMGDTEVQNHVKASHPELATKTPEELTAMMEQMVQPVAAMA